MKFALTALIPVWIFAWATGGNALMNWVMSDSNKDRWWSVPATLALGMPGLFAMAGGIVFVILLWLD